MNPQPLVCSDANQSTFLSCPAFVTRSLFFQSPSSQEIGFDQFDVSWLCSGNQGFINAGIDANGFAIFNPYMDGPGWPNNNGLIPADFDNLDSTFTGQKTGISIPWGSSWGYTKPPGSGLNTFSGLMVPVTGGVFAPLPGVAGVQPPFIAGGGISFSTGSFPNILAPFSSVTTQIILPAFTNFNLNGFYNILCTSNNRKIQGAGAQNPGFGPVRSFLNLGFSPTAAAKANLTYIFPRGFTIL